MPHAIHIPPPPKNERCTKEGRRTSHWPPPARKQEHQRKPERRKRKRKKEKRYGCIPHTRSITIIIIIIFFFPRLQHLSPLRRHRFTIHLLAPILASRATRKAQIRVTRARGPYVTDREAQTTGCAWDDLHLRTQ
ncbi:hypothetical protein GQ607_010400 [Colletotrichum asianum]|uniref:Uncharacterized protein n=1 Tax=Colletotrichum asianum TaxID=702518 RepID=A0A8H3W903_9PEZI|nr:hypothetical protein GQ607_010400 [Colletotrichum asianum]